MGLDQLVAAGDMSDLLNRIVKGLEVVEQRFVVFEEKFKLFEDSSDPCNTRAKEFFLSTLCPSTVPGCFIEGTARRIDDVKSEKTFRNVVVAMDSVLEVCDCAAQLVLQMSICKRLFLEGLFQTLRILEHQREGRIVAFLVIGVLRCESVPPVMLYSGRQRLTSMVSSGEGVRRVVSRAAT